MLEKLKEHDIIDPKTDKVIGKIGCDLREIMDKLNELVDTVNTIQKEREAERFEIQEWIGILEAVRKSVNVHEKQIDELQMKAEPEKCETRSENVLDKFAEQCKWLGKLCKFWDGDKQMSHLCWGILYMITPTSPLPFCCSLGDGKTFDYEHCEPVKPDDDIIYKGE